MTHTADLRLDLSDARQAAAVARAIAVELADGPDGVTATCSAEGATLVASVRAPDLPGLRAAITSLVRLADAGAGAARLAR